MSPKKTSPERSIMSVRHVWPNKESRKDVAPPFRSMDVGCNQNVDTFKDAKAELGVVEVGSPDR